MMNVLVLIVREFLFKIVIIREIKYYYDNYYDINNYKHLLLNLKNTLDYNKFINLIIKKNTEFASIDFNLNYFLIFILFFIIISKFYKIFTNKVNNFIKYDN